MSKYSEIVALLEYVDKKNSKPTKRFRDREKPVELDLVDILRKKQREAKVIEDFLKEQEKLNKKEEKKDEKKGRAFTFAEGVILAYMAQFILGPLYQHYVAALH